MQGTYTHIPETNYVPREHGVAAILLCLFMVLISLLAVLNLLYFYISTFRSMCAVPIIIIIIIIINLLPHLCRVFRIISLKQTMFVQCIELQLYCTYLVVHYYYYYCDQSIST